MWVQSNKIIETVFSGKNYFSFLSITDFITSGMFGSVVAVVFQSAYRTEIHQNDVFYFF